MKAWGLPQNGLARGAGPRPGPGREHGDCPKIANRTLPKPEKQADFPLRWSAVLENWRVAATGPLQNSSSEHLRTGKTRFRTGASKNLTQPHRPKANTNASSIELELVEKKKHSPWGSGAGVFFGTGLPPPLGQQDLGSYLSI